MGKDSPVTDAGRKANSRSPAAWTGTEVAEAEALVPAEGTGPPESSWGSEASPPSVPNCHPW